MNHTPTPWHRNVSPAAKYPIYASATGNPEARDWIHVAAVLPGNPNAEADLDFIVRACNAHDQVLLRLEQAEWHLDRMTREVVGTKASDDWITALQAVRVALKLARGES